ncbi:MAG: hypothetical protein ACK55I_12745, partial [bacterium]
STRARRRTERHMGRKTKREICAQIEQQAVTPPFSGFSPAHFLLLSRRLSARAKHFRDQRSS